MIHVLATRPHNGDRPLANDQIHQVEVVTALLDQRSAGVASETVPLTDLVQEREAMLTDAHHVDVTYGAALDFVDQSAHRRHVAVLKADPCECGTSLGCGDHVEAFFRRNAHGFLREHVQVRCQQITKHRVVCVVGRHQYYSVTHVGFEQIPMVGKGRHTLADVVCAVCEGDRVGIRYGRDSGSVHFGNVLDVLNAHHASSDDAVADLIHRERIAA